VGSEMCIRDRPFAEGRFIFDDKNAHDFPPAKIHRMSALSVKER